MSKEIKIVIGANYGDEGKGLITRYFSLDAMSKHADTIAIFHNGTAQRGHTVDYTANFRHVYHHFNSGTAEGVPTYFSHTFLIHPMEFRREYNELISQGITPPIAYFAPGAKVITPFDMLIDKVTEDWIELQRGEREYGSCCFGSWCFTDRDIRDPSTVYNLTELYCDKMLFSYYMRVAFQSCVEELVLRGVDVEQLPQWREYFYHPEGELNSKRIENMIVNFFEDMKFFYQHSQPANFDEVYNSHDYIIFENGQGLGLDMDVKNDWHTTSKTGLYNPYHLLEKKEDFNAEICYVTRSYLTRHGVGPLEEAVVKSEINAEMVDRTNEPNPYQGGLRYGYLEDQDQAARIALDLGIVKNDTRFKSEMAITHCNEFIDSKDQSKYMSDNPFSVKERD